jgi:hypothetical protein
LLKVQGVLLLVVLEAIRDVVLVEGLMELSPQHLMAVRKGSVKVTNQALADPRSC